MATSGTAGSWTPRTRSPSSLTTWGRRPATRGLMMSTARWRAGGAPWTQPSGPTSRSTIPAASAPYVQASSDKHFATLGLLKGTVHFCRCFLFTSASCSKLLWISDKRTFPLSNSQSMKYDCLDYKVIKWPLYLTLNSLCSITQMVCALGQKEKPVWAASFYKYIRCETEAGAGCRALCWCIAKFSRFYGSSILSCRPEKHRF